MKIEINEKPDRKFYDELLYVTSYYKKIKKKPNKKITTITKELMKDIGIILLLLLIELFFYFEYQDNIFLFMIGFIGLILIFFILYLIAVQKRIKDFLKDNTKTIISINESGVELVKENIQHIQVDWNSIDFILINKYSICLLPKNITNIIIALDTKNKKEFLEGIKKYDKDDLIVDNTELDDRNWNVMYF